MDASAACCDIHEMCSGAQRGRLPASRSATQDDPVSSRNRVGDASSTSRSRASTGRRSKARFENMVDSATRRVAIHRVDQALGMSERASAGRSVRLGWAFDVGGWLAAIQSSGGTSGIWGRLGCRQLRRPLRHKYSKASGSRVCHLYRALGLRVRRCWRLHLKRIPGTSRAVPVPGNQDCAMSCVQDGLVDVRRLQTRAIADSYVREAA